MQGKSTHSAWLTFMYPRLELARDLLSEDGCVFISLDDNETTNAKFLCDLIFGEGNFIGQITVVANPRGRDYGGVARMHDYILAYRKTEKCEINLIDDEDGEFTQFDELGGFELRELRNRNIKFNKENRPNLYYPFYIDTTHKDKHNLYDISIDPKEGWFKLYPLESQGVNTVWRWGKEKALANLNVNIKAKAMKNGSFQIVEKYREARKMARSVWWDKDTNTEKGTLLVKELFDGLKVFDYPKPIEMLGRICQMATDVENDNIVLDFFSGSASMAHAIMQFNTDADTNHKFIMVQLPEDVKKGSIAEMNGYKTIDEIGRERIRRAAKKIKEENPEKAETLDLGFKTYYLRATDKQTLDKIIDFDPNMPLDAEDIKSKFGKDTVIETWKIKDGYGFNAKVEGIDLKGYTAYLLTDSKVGTSLYLIDDMPDNAIVELVRKIEAYELNVDRIIEYGYAFSHATNTALRSNLKTLKNRNAIEPIIRY